MRKIRKQDNLMAYMHGKSNIKYQNILMDRQSKLREYMKDPNFNMYIWKGCKSKKKYNTFEEANEKLVYANSGDNNISIYKCKFCDGYHLGHSRFHKH